jgi:hypothetical protein
MYALRSFAFETDADADLDADLECHRSARETGDYCSQAGALALKSIIEAYWRTRGHEVVVALAATGFDPALRAARFDVRSDLVNGLPRAARRQP